MKRNQERDAQIVADARAGATAAELSENYHLTIKRIYGIVPNGIFQRGANKPKSKPVKTRKARNLMRWLGSGFVEHAKETGLVGRLQRKEGMK